MVKLERDVDVEVPTKVINANAYAMIAPMARNILTIIVGIFIVNGLFID
jgi:hypothetical protein